MPHLISAPSWHAAHVVLKHFTLEVRPKALERIPKLQADARCVAIFIDFGTQIFNVVKLRPELMYWQKRMTAGTITALNVVSFLRRLESELDKLPKLKDAPVSFVWDEPIKQQWNQENIAAQSGYLDSSWRSGKHTISQPAVEATKQIYAHYAVTCKKPDFTPEEEAARMGLLIDVCTDVFRCVQAYPVIRERRMQIEDGKLTREEVANFLKNLGIQLEHLPNYEERQEEVKLIEAIAT